MFGRKKLDDNGKIVKHKKVRLGVAFGGGGLRGLGHIGVIKAFEELGFVQNLLLEQVRGVLLRHFMLQA